MVKRRVTKKMRRWLASLPAERRELYFAALERRDPEVADQVFAAYDAWRKSSPAPRTRHRDTRSILRRLFRR